MIRARTQMRYVVHLELDISQTAQQALLGICIEIYLCANLHLPLGPFVAKCCKLNLTYIHQLELDLNLFLLIHILYMMYCVRYFCWQRYEKASV